MYASRSVPSLLNIEELPQVGQQNGKRNIQYRLQTSAYVTKENASPSLHRGSNFAKSNVCTDSPHHFLPVSKGTYGIKSTPSSKVNLKSETNLRFTLQLPSASTDTKPTKVHDTSSRSHTINSTDNHLNKERRQSKIFQTQKTSTLTKLIPKQLSRSQTARSMIVPAKAPQIPQSKRRRFSTEDDPDKLAMKISVSCTGKCCYCVFSALLGPVKVYITRAEKPKKEPFLQSIKDGNGRPVIPRSRKGDLMGLVYDPLSHSLHPPARGQRPMFLEHRQSSKVQQKTSKIKLKNTHK